MEAIRKISVPRRLVLVVPCFSRQTSVLNSHCTEVLKTPEGSIARCTADGHKVQGILLSRHTLIFYDPPPPKTSCCWKCGPQLLAALQWLLQFRLLPSSALLLFIRLWWHLGFLWKPIVRGASCGRTMGRKISF